MAEITNGFIRRLEAGIKRCEDNIEKSKKSEEVLKIKLDSGKIDHSKYHRKKAEMDRDIRAFNARIHTLQGGILKERRHIKEERANKADKAKDAEKSKTTKKADKAQSQK